MKASIIVLIVMALWIHFAPQAVFFQRAYSYQCDMIYVPTHTQGVRIGLMPLKSIEYKWSWWSLKFYDVYPECNL